MPEGSRVARKSRGDRGRVVLQAPRVRCAVERRGEQVLHRQALALEPSSHGDRLGLWRRGRREGQALRPPCQRPRPAAVLRDEFNLEAGALARLYVGVQVCVRAHPDLGREEVGCEQCSHKLTRRRRGRQAKFLAYAPSSSRENSRGFDAEIVLAPVVRTILLGQRGATRGQRRLDRVGTESPPT